MKLIKKVNILIVGLGLLGFRKVSILGVKEHDEMIAFLS